MTQSTQTRPQAIAPLAISLALLSAAIVALVLASELEWLERETIKRAGGILLGLVLVGAGNVLPKLVAPLSGREPASAGAGADRLAGWVFVLAGLAMIAIWLIAPVELAAPAVAVLGVAAFLLAVAALIVQGARQGGAMRTPPSPFSDRAVALRYALGMILAGLLAAFTMILADEIWGDQVARWMAVFFPLALWSGLVLIITLSAARSR